MKIFAIINKCIRQTIGYFFCREKTDECYIELCKGVDYWDMPFILDHFSKQEKWTVDSYHSRMFVRQRVIPPDRQNIGTILKENGLEEYDEIKLFLLAEGRCAQDDCYIKRVKSEDLPIDIKERRKHVIVSATPINGGDYLIQFADRSCGIFSVEIDRDLARLFEYYKRININKSGTEFFFDGHPGISYEDVYNRSKPLEIDSNTIVSAALNSIMTTQDVMDYLCCTRQNINDYVKRNRLHPLTVNARLQLFDRREIMGIETGV